MFNTLSEKFLNIEGPAGNLEAIVKETPSAHKVIIVCHPHPLHGGTMNNKVVTTVARTFEHKGFTTLRFNYRGVGKSAGSFAQTIGETEDLLAVINWVQQNYQNPEISLAGFSFGSFIAANVANQITVTQVISIAPPVHHMDFNSLRHIKSPWLVIQGDQDEIVPFQQVVEFAENPPSPLKFVVLKGCGHFFHGCLTELAEVIKTNCSF